MKQAEEEAARVKVQEDLKKEASVLVQEVSLPIGQYCKTSY